MSEIQTKSFFKKSMTLSLLYSSFGKQPVLSKKSSEFQKRSWCPKDSLVSLRLFLKTPAMGLYSLSWFNILTSLILSTNLGIIFQEMKKLALSLVKTVTL